MNQIQFNYSCVDPSRFSNNEEQLMRNKLFLNQTDDQRSKSFSSNNNNNNNSAQDAIVLYENSIGHEHVKEMNNCYREICETYLQKNCPIDEIFNIFATKLLNHNFEQIGFKKILILETMAERLKYKIQYEKIKMQDKQFQAELTKLDHILKNNRKNNTSNLLDAFNCPNSSSSYKY